MPLLLVVIAAVTALGYSQARQIIDAEIHHIVASNLDQIVYALERDLRPHARTVEFLARRVERSPPPRPLDWYRQVLDQTLHVSPESFAFGIWYEPYRHTADRKYFGPYLYHRQGRSFFTTAYNSPAYDYFHWDWYRRGAASPGRAVWSPVYLDPVTQVKMVTASAPFFSPTGQFMGVTTGDLDLENLQQLLTATRSGKPGWVLLLDTDGRYVVAPDAARVLKVRIQADPNPSLAQAGARMMARRQGTDVYDDTQGPVHLFFRTVPDTGWLVAVAIPAAALFGPLQDWLRLSLIIAVAASGAAAIGAIWLSNQLTEPIGELVTATRRMRVGDFPSVATHAGPDEMLTLEQSFNAMSRRLHDSSDALHTEQQRLAAIIGSLAEGLLIVDQEGRIVQHNASAERLLGFPSGALCGQTCEAIFGPDCYGGDDVAVERMADVDGDDGRHVFRLNRVPMRQGGSVITFRDVTQEEAVSRMKSEFISLASHELRTPLTIAKGYVDLIRLPTAHNVEPQRREQMLLQASRQLDRLARIITDLLNVSRIEQGRLPWHPQPFDAAAMLADVHRSFANLADQRGQTLLLAPPPAGPTQALADPDQVTQILTNLVDNALKYSGAHSRITLTLTPLREWVRLTVSDDGPGIPTAEQGRIFEKFHRIAGPMTLRERGTGLGLYLSMRLADMQNGVLLVCSHEGEGSSFSLMLPAAAAQGKPPSRAAAR
jgi:PAS domain S-box-containing protein